MPLNMTPERGIGMVSLFLTTHLRYMVAWMDVADGHRLNHYHDGSAAPVTSASESFNDCSRALEV